MCFYNILRARERKLQTLRAPREIERESLNGEQRAHLLAELIGVAS